MLQTRLTSRRGIALAGLILALAAPSYAEQDRLYVNQSASGANDGTTWVNAFTELRDAIEYAESSLQHGVSLLVRSGRQCRLPYGVSFLR